jgi:uncharacterized protein
MINFEWDENKNRSNIRKHGIDFADIYRVFEGPMIVQVDDREEYGEVRWKGTGYIINNVVIVVYVEIEDDAIRVISARKALRYEWRQFEQVLRNRLG